MNANQNWEVEFNVDGQRKTEYYMGSSWDAVEPQLMAKHPTAEVHSYRMAQKVDLDVPVDEVVESLLLREFVRISDLWNESSPNGRSSILRAAAVALDHVKYSHAEWHELPSHIQNQVMQKARNRNPEIKEELDGGVEDFSTVESTLKFKEGDLVRISSNYRSSYSGEEGVVKKCYDEGDPSDNWYIVTVGGDVDESFPEQALEDASID